MNPRGLIPNAFTMGNLVAGCMAIWVLLDTRSFALPATLIAIAAFLDLFDGFFARLLKADGPIGKQLDSLADAVSFGVAPALIIVELSQQQGNTDAWYTFVPLLLAIASVYRLAKFNVDTRQSERFLGLPTPANALFWISIAIIAEDALPIADHFNPWSINLFVMLMSFLMISELPLIALKFKEYSWSKNLPRYVLLIVGALLVAVCHFAFGSVFLAVPILLLLYLLISVWDQRRNNAYEVPRRN
jgi:CDP-diacylglycerol--serine O-phosphatidyltransferase